MVLQQHEAAQLRPEMTLDAGRQRSHHRCPVRQGPALAAVADRLRAQHQLLHHEVLISFEPRAGRCDRLENPLLDRHTRR